MREPAALRPTRQGLPFPAWGKPSGEDTAMRGHGYLNALKNAKSTVYGPAREKIGTLGNIFMDVRSGDADFVSVHVGLFGSEEHMVSLAGAVMTDGHLQVRYPKDVIRNAPHVDPLAGLVDEAKDMLEKYYAAMDSGSGR
ncbi:hypothetical protein [Paeniglutamicibacter gangotriensis]|nr:hypothetical protein [Paeniglutamicibacter gangotriensis]